MLSYTEIARRNDRNYPSKYERKQLAWLLLGQIKMITRQCQFKVECDSTNKLDNFSEMNYFLERCKLLKLS